MNKKGHWIKQGFAFALLNLGLVYGLTYFGLGCDCDGGGGDDPPSWVHTCVGDIDVTHTPIPTASMIMCCDPQAQPQPYATNLSYVNRTPELCQKCDPEKCVTQFDEVDLFAGILTTVEAAIQMAAAQAGSAKAVTAVPSASPTYEAAFAPSTSQAGEGDTTKNDAAKGGKNALTPIAGRVVNSSNFGGSQGSASGGNTLGLGGSTQPNTPSPTPNPSFDPNSLGGVYNRGGSASSAALSKSLKNKESVGAVSVEGGVTSVQSFGQDNTNGNSSEILKIDDPEDYFTRINLEENIFALVHRKYQQKEKDLTAK